MNRTRRVALVLAAGMALAAPAISLAQSASTLPPAQDADGNIVETFALVDGEMVAPPAIEMGDEATIARIFYEGTSNSQVMDILTHLSLEIGPRLTGSSQVEEANEWTRDQFEMWGLDNSHLQEWGTVGMRFDRGPSWGKSHLGRDSRDIEALTTLAWVPGTNGAVRGKAVRLPTTPEELAAVKDDLAGAWVVIPTDFSGRTGIRGVTGSVRARYNARAELRDGASSPAEPGPVIDGPLAGSWAGTISGGSLGDQSYPMRLMLTKDADGAITGGKMGVGESTPSDIDGLVFEGETISFEWESAYGRSAYTLAVGEGSLEGNAARIEEADVVFDVSFARPEIVDTASVEDVLAAVLAAGPAGFVSSSKDTRVWTTSVGGWREMTSEDLAEDLEVIISEPDYDYINSKIADGAPLELEFNMDNTLVEGPIPVYNTIAEITGTEWPEEVVIVSAHMDSWNGPGSLGVTDNGTGSCVTLEAARILAAVGARPKRTIRFILWTGEEQGLLGSRAYVQGLSDEEKANIVCCFVDDGGTNTQGGIQGIASMRDYLAAATAPINGRIWDETDGNFLNVNVQINDAMPQGGGSDHASFNREGIPGFYWDEVGRAVYRYGWHTQHDKLDLAIPNYLRQSATNTAITAYNLACAPEQLTRQGDE